MEDIIAALWGIAGLGVGYAAGMLHALLSIKIAPCPTCSIETGDRNG